MPTPRITRPSATRSSVPTTCASTTGWRSAGSNTAVPSLTRRVRAATAASSVRGSWRGRAMSESPIHTASKPARSPRSAISSSGAVWGRPDMTDSRVGNNRPSSTAITPPGGLGSHVGARPSPNVAISYVLVIREGTFAALRTPTYFRYWLGLVFYVLGHRAEYVTYAWMMWQLTKDPMYLGYLGMAQGLPLLVFQLVGGVLADRVNRLRLLVVTQALTSIMLTLAFALTLFGIVRVHHLLVLAALSNTFRAFDEPSRMSLIPQLVDRARLRNAITLGSIPWQAGRMIGPS